MLGAEPSWTITPGRWETVSAPQGPRPGMGRHICIDAMQGFIMGIDFCSKCGNMVDKKLLCGKPCPWCGWKYPLGDCSDN